MRGYSEIKRLMAVVSTYDLLGSVVYIDLDLRVMCYPARFFFGATVIEDGYCFGEFKFESD